jgi:hypothetical protein
MSTIAQRMRHRARDCRFFRDLQRLDFFMRLLHRADLSSEEVIQCQLTLAMALGGGEWIKRR